LACKKIRFNVTSTGVVMEKGHYERKGGPEKEMHKAGRVPDKEMHKAGRGAG
jgi:hypothetical protein